MKICFISNYNVGLGLSGGDSIFIELLRGWSRHSDMVLAGCAEACEITKRAGVENIRFVRSTSTPDASVSYGLLSLMRHTVRRLIAGIRMLRTADAELMNCDIVYSVSDFYPDFFPGFLLKCRYPKMTWIAGFYLFAPPPWAENSPYKGKDSLRGLLYWLLQKPTHFLAKRFADVVFVTSEPDVAKFVCRRISREKILVIQGGVDVSEAKRSVPIPVSDRNYDACFMGRFHYQKGILLLLDIWRKVCDVRPESRLAVIGDGHLRAEVEDKIKRLELSRHVELLGFRTGASKTDVFKQSRMMLHPATYDSGGMAAAEGMAFGLPGVSFDLEALRTYYPKGMVKVPCFDEYKFVETVLRLLSDDVFYQETARAAKELVFEVWDWEKRSERVWQNLRGVLPVGR